MIIDIHAHTSNHRIWGLHTESATLADLEELARKYGISNVVLMATYFTFKGSGLHNLELLDRIQARPLFRVFGSLDASADVGAGIDELSRLAEAQRIAGIKLYPGYQPVAATSPRLVPVFHLAQKHRLPIMFHSGELHHCCPAETLIGERRCRRAICPIDYLEDLARPRSLARVAASWPDLIFIFSHLGNPFFDELRQAMRDLPNVWTDISGQFKSGTAEDTPTYRQTIVDEIKRFLDLDNGLQRVMFGTDFPIQSYADSIDLVERLGLTSIEKQNIYYANAARLLGI